MIFMIWRHGENKFTWFIDKLNKLHPTRKFTCDSSGERVHFLDVQVILDNKILNDLYVKETDSHQCVQSSPCHPYRCVNSIS